MKIEGRHWVFIIGFISATITSRWSKDVSKYMVDLLFYMGIGLLILKLFQL